MIEYEKLESLAICVKEIYDKALALQNSISNAEYDSDRLLSGVHNKCNTPPRAANLKKKLGQINYLAVDVHSELWKLYATINSQLGG